MPSLVRYLAIAPVVMVLTLVSGQFALSRPVIIASADTRSKLTVDYRPWSYVVVRPVRPEILGDIQLDHQRFPDVFGNAPGLATQVGSLWDTPLSPSPSAVAVSPTPAILLSGTPLAAFTPTSTPAFTEPAPVIPTATATPPLASSPTPSPWPSLTASPTSRIPSDWFDPNWKYRKAIVIHADNVAADLSGFPVLISLPSDTDLAAHAQDNGDDIFFTAANGTAKFSHEIEAFSGSTGGLVAWVKAARLSGATDTVLYMYYGNPSASNQQDPTGVWDASYRGVWHLGDTLAGQSGMVKDSTGYGNHGAAMEGMSSQNQTGGQIGGSLRFDGVDDVVDVPNHASLQIESQITLETWMSRPLLDGGVILMKDWGSEINYSLVASWWPNHDHLEFYYDSADGSGVEQVYASANSVLGVGSWQHLAATFSFGNGDSCTLYVNGSPVAGTWTSGDGSLPADLSDEALLSFASSQMNPLQVTLDEIRISSIIRTPAWITTEFNNQSSPSSFYSLGIEESLP